MCRVVDVLQRESVCALVNCPHFKCAVISSSSSSSDRSQILDE
jgi:hypothetical protein